MATPQTTVFVIDDNATLLKGLKLLIESAGLSAETYTTAEAFLEAYDGSKPGCAVVDVRMPGLSGLQLQQELARRNYDLPVIFMTGHGDIAMAVEALKAGAYDFIEKPFSDEVLLGRIQEAVDLGKKSWQAQQQRQEFKKRLELLTEREREVMLLVARGKLNRVIGEELGISEKTVKNHRAAVMEKLQVGSLAQIVRNLIQIGAI